MRIKKMITNNQQLSISRQIIPEVECMVNSMEKMHADVRTQRIKNGTYKDAQPRGQSLNHENNFPIHSLKSHLILLHP